MTSSKLRASSIIAAFLVGLSGLALAQDGDDEPDPAILRLVLADDAPTTLQVAIAASERQGIPISAKFAMSDSDIHLSVYTATANGLVETVLNPKTGTVSSAQPITDAEDLADARVQKAAMEKATVSLRTATERAIAENADSRAVSAVPQLRNGHVIARVKLQRSSDSITVSEPLN